MMRWVALVAMASGSFWLAAAPVGAQTCPAPGAGTDPCDTNCASISAPTVSGTRGEPVDIPITFEPAATVGQGGQGQDEVSAIAFTIGVGPEGSAPLSFTCTDGNIADGQVIIGSALAANFNVVIENAQCNNRSRCLCPDTGAGQTRDNFVNVVVYGPKDLPEQGPVQIPVIPAGANALVTLRMQVAGDAPASIPLHVFSSLTGTAAKPQFAANLSIGDQAACDVTASGADMNVAFVDGAVNIEGTPTGCTGDCDGNGTVAINELILGVNIAIGNQPVSVCLAFDVNDSGGVEINELIQAVGNAISGCPS